MISEHICCEILSSKMDEAGKRGLAIFPFKNPFEPYNYAFFLQFRNIDEENKTGSHTVFDIAIEYCPWCGSKLSNLIETDKASIERLALKNKHLIKGF